MIVYMENPKEPTTKTPRTDKWVQQGYETYVQHIQINCVFIYNEWIFKKQNYKPNTIYNYSKENEILKDALKTSQNLYAESYKLLMKEIREDLNKERCILFMDCRVNIVKILILSIYIYV